MLKVTVSGDYRTSGGKEGNVVDFESVTGLMPDCDLDENGILSHVKVRYLGKWIKEDKRYTARFADARTTYIDKIEAVSGAPSCIGKNIKDLSWDELQDLAVLKNLLRIPLVHSTDLRAARETAYLQYAKHILMNDIDTKKESYNFLKLPAIIVTHDGIVAAAEEQKSNEAMIASEQEASVVDTNDTTFTLEELKKIAKERGVKYPPAIGQKKLYDLLFGK